MVGVLVIMVNPIIISISGRHGTDKKEASNMYYCLLKLHPYALLLDII